MKRFILLTIAAMLFANITFPQKLFVSHAEGGNEYLRVITTDTPFFADENMSEFLFYLPYTYYVRVLSDSTDVVHAEIVVSGATLDGYVLKSALFSDGLSVTKPYPEITLLTSKNAVLYDDINLSFPTLYAFKSREMTYLGYANHGGENIYFVSYNSHLGYVKESDVMPFTIDNHPNPLTFIKTPEESETQKDSTRNDESDLTVILRIVIIGALALAGFTGLIIALAKKPKKSTAFYDENEYES